MPGVVEVNMSRVGKQIIDIPSGVSIDQADNTVTISGPKGTLTRQFKPAVKINIDDQIINCQIKESTAANRSLWGTYASHLKNMVTGVTEGFTKKLIIEGVGFKANISGDQLTLDLGFSHQVTIPIPKDLTVAVEKNVITVTGVDKEAVGQLAAIIRAKKKTEPYKGKGIRYDNEVVLRKQGKKTTT